MMSHTKRGLALTAAVAMTLLAACGDAEDTEDATTPAETSDTTDDSDDTTDEDTDDAPPATAGGEITIGVPAGWDEGVVVSHLMEIALEEQGYDVTLINGEIGVIFAGLSTGDTDLLLDSWLPITHATYLEEYGDQLEQLGTWYEDAKLALTVNNDAPITSIAELADNADAFNNEIIGIDGGAGITRITREEVIPTYGLEGMNFKISSTAAMLAELDGAMAEGRNIVVTLWSPHWAYGAYDIRDLEDPEGAYGEAEEVHSLARLGFTEEFPEVADMIGNFELTDEELSDLENYSLNENADRETAETVGEWLEEQPEVRDRMNLS